MNYRHIYHAGNFADVFKHLILIGVSKHLSSKVNPFCFLDIHAGAGIYDLQSIETQKTLEYKNGVEILFNILNLDNKVSNKIDNNIDNINQYNHVLANPNLTKQILSNSILNSYKSILKYFNYPHFYPGSPLIMLRCLRTQDSMILIEKHPEEVAKLKYVFKKIKRNIDENINKNNENINHENLKQTQNVAIHEQDGYSSLKAFLPPLEKRGLILIDPPFEATDEWQKILNGILIGLKRFSNGIFAIWYPIKNKKIVNDFLLKIKEMNCPKALNAELYIYPEDIEHSLNGCGMIIINAPWQFDQTLEELLSILWKLFSYEHSGYYKVQNI